MIVELFTLFSLAGATPPAALEGWIKFNTQVRDGKYFLDKPAGQKELSTQMKALDEWAKKFTFEQDQKWIFPLVGHDLKSVGGKNGSGFLPNTKYGASPIKGYDFLDGNKHGGHPAHDIFIEDKNQDSLDDQNKKSVEVVSLVDAVVIFTSSDWTPKSDLRGGNVVWAYNPNLKMIFYYAHLDKVLVEPGAFLKAGATLGTVGRTGFSAYPKRSPTHLHLMVLKYEDEKLVPYNYFSKLK